MPNHQPQPQKPAADTNQPLANKAQRAAEQAKDSAVERVKQTREFVSSGLEERRHEAADRIRQIGITLRASRDLNPGDEFMASVFDSASEQVERVANYVAEA